MNNTPEISIVSPVYLAEKIVDELVNRICVVCNQENYDYEIILIEDGSPDNSWDVIENNCKKNSRVKGIKLSRNFGQHYAITAGLTSSSGKYVVIMDCDLQDNPKYITSLYNKINEGFEIVYTQKKQRNHSAYKNILATLFNNIFNFLVDNKNMYNKNIGAYSIISRKVVDAFLLFKDTDRHYLMILRWLGFNNTFIEIIHDNRYEGKSSYNFIKLIHHAIRGITSHSDKLLRISTYMGFLITFLSIIAILTVVVLYFTHGFLSGWASLIISILFSTGLILSSIGILGLYIGRIFEQTKNRPLYIVEKQINF